MTKTNCTKWDSPGKNSLATAMPAELSPLLIWVDRLQTVSLTLLGQMFDQRFLVLAKEQCHFRPEFVLEAAIWLYIVDTKYIVLVQYTAFCHV